MTTLDEIKESLNEGYCGFMGAEIVDWDESRQLLTMTMKMRSEFDGGAGPGHCHGGVIGAFVDTCATFAVLCSGAPRAPTANYRLDLLRPVINSGLKGIATIRRSGRTLATVDVDAYDDEGRLCAIGRASFVVS
jgi:uncharacterized protein (TIGR00369 family)